MTSSPSRIYVLAAGLAVLMHLLLFAAIRPQSNVKLAGVLVPPNTSYLFQSTSKSALSGLDIRTIRSPVIFSLPSTMGFSRGLGQQDVNTRLTFSQNVKSEHFLAVDPADQNKGRDLHLEQLMVTSEEPDAPDIPVDIFTPKENRIAARRVNLAPALKDRMEGGVVLPSELNQQTPNPWEVHAAVSVSEAGSVSHVFLDQPLESPELNKQVLQLLYKLRFKPGAALEGSIEIYSPESETKEEAKP